MTRVINFEKYHKAHITKIIIKNTDDYFCIELFKNNKSVIDDIYFVLDNKILPKFPFSVIFFQTHILLRLKSNFNFLIGKQIKLVIFYYDSVAAPYLADYLCSYGIF